MKSRSLLVAMLATVAAAFAGCGTPDAPGAGAAAGGGAPAAAGGRPGAGGPPGGPGMRPGGGAGAPVNVVTAAVRIEALAQEVEALGTARANEAVDITSKVANTITAIRFGEGQFVRSGTVLVEFDSAQVRADLASAQAGLVEARAQYERSRALSGSAAFSKAQLDQIEATLRAAEARVAAAEARLSDTIIRAPFAGRTGLRSVSVGSFVAPGTVITTLDDVSTIKLDFAVPETFVALMQDGLAITARSVAYPDRPFRGKVTSVDSRIDPVTRSVLVRAELPNPQGLLKPGMFLGVRLKREAAPALVLPEAAIVPEQGRSFVFVVTENRVERREVNLGRRRTGEVEVLSGVREDERVVVEGTLRLRDGAVVREVGGDPGAARAASQSRRAS